jgi:SAM-dependent methyltransferase
MKKEFYAEYFKIEDKHWWFVGRRNVFLHMLDKYLPPTSDGRERRILDLGCGTGTMLKYLSRYGRAQGADADEGAVQFCHERGVHDVQQIAEMPDVPLPFEDNTFDLVTALDVVEHIEDDRGALRELYRVIRPGGMLMISVPAYKFLWGAQDEISHHKRRYTTPEIRERMRDAGFKVRRLSYFNTFLFPAIAGVRVLRPYKPGSADLKSDFTMTKPGPANTVLGKVFALEAPVVERTNLPFGVSILCLAYKPGGKRET